MNSEHPGGHVFQQTGTIFVHIQGYILTKFHENWAINVKFKSVNKQNAPPPGDHVFQPTGTIFKLVQDIIGSNLLTKFHANQTINVASRVHIKKYTPPPYIIGTNLLTKVLTRKMPRPLVAMINLMAKFHNDRTINVASRMLTRKNATLPWRPCFSTNRNHFKLIQNIIGPNLLTKFHEDRTINVASRVFTSKNAPPPEIVGMNLLTKFHEDRTINVASRVFTLKNAPPPGGHVFKATSIIFKLIKNIISRNFLTKFHEDRTINVDSRVLTSQDFQANITIFELVQDIIKTNLLTTFHEDWTINATVDAAPLNARRMTDKRRSQKLTMSTMCSVRFSARKGDKFISLKAALKTHSDF
ncbi:hypothetical protein DPMN_050856 [Dreissena polymorpha]|uniref:Uncharacterized protein n=1 Tax=Dreissena polymorpha TaxID=45954 RepID=A0A9D4CHJ8_DREPO|nr:hypothetical protein DPMN_050856 [Dreissena polymorpha]